jgi:CRISPR-associated protein Csb1
MADATSVPLTLDLLSRLVAGEAVAIRGRATLEPAGGPGDKVFPPTHSVERGATSRYAIERRRVEGEDVTCVLLDSVQSQANRMEESLQRLWTAGRISLPVITVDLTSVAPDVGTVTSLSAPHRIADALLRDSLSDGKLFRLSPIGKSFTDATPRNASALFKVCPTALVFGLWDSTGPRGGLGSKFARAIVSEIVGLHAVPGAKTASRIDPVGIVTRAGGETGVLVALDPNEGWTHDPSLAKHEKGKPVRLGDGRVSEVNHSNIPPTIDDMAGGVTIGCALQTAVLSLAALRKLAFGGAETEAQTALAALGILALLANEEAGHDLRSRCLLVPRRGEALKLEAVRRDGETQVLSLDLEGAIALFNAAVASLPESLRFTNKPGEPLATLKPSPKLVHLIAKSRELAAAGVELEGE